MYIHTCIVLISESYESLNTTSVLQHMVITNSSHHGTWGALLPSRAGNKAMDPVVYLVRHGQSTWNLAAKRLDLWTMFSQVGFGGSGWCWLMLMLVDELRSWNHLELVAIFCCHILLRVHTFHPFHLGLCVAPGRSSSDSRGRGTSKAPEGPWRVCISAQSGIPVISCTILPKVCNIQYIHWESQQVC